MKKFRKILSCVSAFTLMTASFSTFISAEEVDTEQKYISNFDSQCNSPDFPTVDSIVDARNQYYGVTINKSANEINSLTAEEESTPFAFSELKSNSWHDQSHNDSKHVGYITEPSTGTNLAEISSKKNLVFNTYRCQFSTNVGPNATLFYCGISSNGTTKFTPDMQYPAQYADTDYISIGSGNTSYMAYLRMY